MTVMQDNDNQITFELFENPRHAVLVEDMEPAPVCINDFLSAEPALSSEYCLNTTAWD